MLYKLSGENKILVRRVWATQTLAVESSLDLTVPRDSSEVNISYGSAVSLTILSHIDCQCIITKQAKIHEAKNGAITGTAII